MVLGSPILNDLARLQAQRPPSNDENQVIDSAPSSLDDLFEDSGQLKPELQEIVAKHSDEFNGRKPETWPDSDSDGE
ncbi:hypothetical protein P9112_003994 [Eukaryota sp. TZLM1-RC]